MTLQLRAYSRTVVQSLRRLPFRHGFRHGFRLAWQTAVALGLTAFAFLLLAWLTLQWAILPHIEDWRPMMERRATESIGVPVKIGAVRVNSSGWIPALELRDVVLRDRAGAEALRLPRIAAAITPRSVLTLHPRFAQLYVEDAHLVVRRDPQGHLHVGGLDMASGGAAVDEGRTLDWFFRQQEIVIRHGALRWIDELRGAPPLELADVDVVVRNGLRTHWLRVDATPPADWGDRFAVRARFGQPLFAGPGNWRRWAGTMYLDLPRGDVAQLRRHVDLPFALDSGHGQLRAWVDVAGGTWRQATVDMGLQDLDVRFAPDLQPLAIAQARGRLSARRDADGVALAAEHFGFRTADGIDWPAGDVRLAWRQQRPKAAPRGAAASAGALEAPGASAISALWTEAATVRGGSFSADRLDLGLMARLAGELPLPAAFRHWLLEARPQGIVQKLQGRWDGTLDHPRTYQASADLAHLSLDGGEPAGPGGFGHPGWRDASMHVDATETGGRATVGLDHGAIELPGVFDQPVLAFDHLAAQVAWQFSPGRDAHAPTQLAVDVDDLRFDNADAAGELQAHWRSAGAGMPADGKAPGPAASATAGVFPTRSVLATVATVARGGGAAASVLPLPAASAASATNASAKPAGPGWLDLRGTLSRGRAQAIARYLPRGLSPATRTWLRDAFHGGDLSAVHFAVRGDLADFPFRKREGEFRIATHVENLGLDYVPATRPADDPEAAVASDWPAFRDVRADVVIDKGQLEIHNAHARLRELELKDVNGTIRSLYDNGATLGLRGRVQGPLADFLHYVDDSPVGGWLGHALKAMTATGNADLDLALDIPLNDAERAKVHGRLALGGGDVRLFPGTPLFGGARGSVEFTQSGFAITGGQARLLGGDATFEGAMQPDGSLRFTGQGVATAEGLRRGLDDPAIAKLGPFLSGQAPYRLQVGVIHGLTEWTLTSPLTGLAATLPAPFAKGAGETWPLRVQSSLTFDPAGRAAPRDTVRVELGTLASAELLREYPAATAAGSPRVLRSAFAVGTALPPAQAGGTAQLKLGAVNGDAWWTVVRGLGSGSPAGSAGASPTAAADPGADAWPRNIALKAQDLLLGGKHLTAVSLQVAPVAAADGERWRVAVDSDQTHGVVEFRPASAGGAQGARVYARLDRLALASSDANGAGGESSSTAAPGTSSNTSSVPALDIVVDSFELDGKHLGKLEVAATQADGARDWRLDRLAVTSPDARFTGSGLWAAGTTRRMSLDFKLELEDAGALLERLGMGRVIKGGKGQLSGHAAWTGSPLELDYPSLGGQLQVSVEQGQFLKVDAGAGRLLGVLSLQSLPRRLLFDFRDLFQEGYAFDHADGDVVIEHGIARTNNLRIRSVSAAILMEGHADLKAETQDLHVVVVPEINAGTASLAYAVINPVIGLGTFLAQIFLRKPLAAAGTRELHITGTWSDPKVETLQNRVAEAAEERGPPAAAAPASASSAPRAPAAAPSAPASGTISP